jgi:hemoglobin
LIPSAATITHPSPTFDRSDLRLLMTRFYDRARRDPLLGPVFDRAIAPDAWAAHIDNLADFWSSVLLAAGTYRGNPAARHAALPDLDAAHFVRWLAIFETTARETLRAADAKRVIRSATNMGKGLQRVVLANRRAVVHLEAHPPTT